MTPKDPRESALTPQDAKADALLAQARALSTTDSTKARQLCRTVMQMYDNNPSASRVRTAFTLLNTIKGMKDDDDDF